MKKLLLVLLVVTLASFLFVGCLPTTPAEGEGEGEGEVESACPTISITSEVEIAGKKYIKGGSQTLTVTFTEATEQVSVYVTAALKDNPSGVPTGALELVMYPDADFKVWTATNRFGDSTGTECVEGYVYVSTCTTCAPCKFPYIIDEYGPCSTVKIYEYPTTGCSCGGLNLRFVTPSAAGDCDVASYCGDTCSGLDTYTVDLYKADPFGDCCDIPCIAPIATCSGTGCDVDCTLSCFDPNLHFTLTEDNSATFYALINLADKVGNTTRYYATIELDSGSNITAMTGYAENTARCTDWTGGTAATGDPLTLTVGSGANAYGECE